MSKKNAGKAFEDDWKESCNKLPIYYLRLKDTAKCSREKTSSFTPSNPYDSLQYKMPFIWLLELKSTNTSVSFFPFTDSGGVPWEKPEGKTQRDIKTTQIKELMEACKYEGVIAGLIINFRPKVMKTKTLVNDTFFIHIRDFLKFAEATRKSVINRDECTEIGVRIDSTLKKVNYKYDIEKFVMKSPKVYLNKGYINKEELIRTRDLIISLVE